MVQQFVLSIGIVVGRGCGDSIKPTFARLLSEGHGKLSASAGDVANHGDSSIHLLDHSVDDFDAL